MSRPCLSKWYRPVQHPTQYCLFQSNTRQTQTRVMHDQKHIRCLHVVQRGRINRFMIGLKTITASSLVTSGMSAMTIFSPKHFSITSHSRRQKLFVKGTLASHVDMAL